MVKSAKVRILSRPFTRNQVKVFFQDHPPNVPKMDPNLLLPRPLSLKMCQKKGSFKTIEDGSKNDTSFKTIGENTGKNDQKSTSFKTIANRVKSLIPRYMVPVDEVSQVISDPQSRKKAQLVTEQLSSGPPLPGSRFNPIYVEPGSVSIDSTRDLQVLFPNSFDCIGDMKGEYDIKTDSTVPPVQHGRWKVPIEYKEIKKELVEIVQQGIITKQTEPTPWVSRMHPKKANGQLRICLDPKDLNKAIICENHKAPALKEIAHVLTGATRFSKVDGNKAFFGCIFQRKPHSSQCSTPTSEGTDFNVFPSDSKCHKISSR